MDFLFRIAQVEANDGRWTLCITYGGLSYKYHSPSICIEYFRFPIPPLGRSFRCAMFST